MPEQTVATPFVLPQADEIRRTAAEILRNPRYDLDESAYESPLLAWIMEQLLSALGLLIRAFNAMNEISPPLALAITGVLVVILVALIVHIVYMFRSALRGRRRLAIDGAIEADPKRLPETWEDNAREALAARDYIGAIRALFRAGLLRLEQARQGTFRLGRTNREYLRAFADTPAAKPLLLFVQTIDAKWYGGGRCSPEDYSLCEQAYSAIEATAGRMADAHRA
jgi:hypothetical protein